MAARKMIVGMVVAILILMGGAAFGRTGVTYYVDVDDGNDGWNGLYEEKQTGDNNDGPWETVVRAVTTAAPNDTVYFREGRYPTKYSATDENIIGIGYTPGAYFSTEADTNNRITFKSYAGETAVITCMKLRDNPNYWTPVDPDPNDPDLPADPNRPVYFTALTEQISGSPGVGRVPNCSEDGVPLRLMTAYYDNGEPSDLTGPGQWVRSVHPKLAFTSGGDVNDPNKIIQAGDIITGNQSDATANVNRTIVYSGSWEDANAGGVVFVEEQVGTFGAENLDVNRAGAMYYNVGTVGGDSSDTWKLYVWSSDGNNPGTHDTAFSEFIHGGSVTIGIPGSLNRAGDANEQDYLTFEDLVIEGSYTAIVIETDYIEIKRCVIRNCYGDGIQVGGAEPADYNNPDDPNDPNYWNSQYGLIEDCNIYKFGESGIDITGGDYWVVRSTKVHDGTHTKADPLNGPSGIMLKNNNIGTVVEKCEIYSLDSGPNGAGIFLGGSSSGNIADEGVDLVAKNNIIREVSGGRAVLFMAAKNCEFSNNLVYDCNLSDTIIRMHSGDVSKPKYNNRDCKIMNNIFYDNEVSAGYGNKETPNGSVVGLESNYNRVDANLNYRWDGNDVNLTEFRELGYEVNSITDNPTFVDLANYDFHLAPNSPCIDAGDPNGDYSGETDIDGQPRVIGSNVDIGSDEVFRVHNVTQDLYYLDIQPALNDACDLDYIEAYPYTYCEAVDFNGVACMLRSADPNDWAVVAATVIDANGATQAVDVDANGTLSGFTITGGTYGVYCDSANPTISKCIIEDNNSAGVYCNGGSPEIENNKICDNSSYGIHSNGSSASIKNNWIYRNGDEGLRFVGTAGTAPVVRNNTIAYNTLRGIYKHGAATSPTTSNCILWANNNDLAGCSATYSCIEDGDAGTGNISSDPNFVDSDANDYHIEVDSPCIDTSNPNEPNSSTDEVDIDGELRVIGIADMGADEVDCRISHWRFDEGSGTTAYDSAGNNDGTIKGDPNWVTGKIGSYALDFDGSGDYVEVADDNSLDITDEITITMWLYQKEQSTSGGCGVTKDLTYKFGPENTPKYVLRMETTGGSWSTQFLKSNSATILDAWTHIAATYDSDANTSRIYINGGLDIESTTAITGTIETNTTNLWIGRGANPYFDGTIDEVIICDRALSSKAIKKLYQNGL